MRKKGSGSLVPVLEMACLITMFSLPVAAQDRGTNSGPIVDTEVRHDLSPALQDIAPVRGEFEEAEHEIPIGRFPRSRNTLAPYTADAGTQRLRLPKVSSSVGLNFDGVGHNGSSPSDSNLAVGSTQVVEWVNKEFAVYNKLTGALVMGPVAGNTLWHNFGGPCQTNNGGDPIVQFDKLNSRWVFAQPVFTGPPYFYCVAVSTTDDATGTFNRYQFSQNQFPDYPKVGIWSDAYYSSFNIFTNGTQTALYVSPRVCAMDGAKMRAGLAATQICFDSTNSILSGSDSTMLPSDLDGANLPPLGEPAFFLELDNTTSNRHVDLWKFHVDFATPANSTLTGPRAIAVNAWNYPCAGTAGTCVVQPGTTQQLDTLGDRLMYRLAYRNFGDHETLVANHSVDPGNGTTAVRWYEIRDPNGTNGGPRVFQQGTFAPDSSYRWMGSIAMDKMGNMALGYSASSPTLFPSIRYTGRVPTDPLGTLESEATLMAGLGSQGKFLSRWGDYTSLALDTDDCTFWYVNEYEQSNGTGNWSTRIASFNFPACPNGNKPDFTIIATPPTQLVNPGGATAYTVTISPIAGYNGNVTLSVTNLPLNTTGNFSVNPIIGGSGSSTLIVTTSTSTPQGNSNLTITGTDGTHTHSAMVNLSVVQPGATLSLTTRAFGNQAVNTTSGVAKVTLTSTGTATLNISSIASSGDFAQTNNCGPSLSPGATCTFSVTFTPTATGARTGAITVTDNAKNSPQTVSLSGTGVFPVVLNPSSWSFSSQAVATTSAAKIVTLINYLKTPLTISSIVPSGDFAETDNCGGSVGPSAKCAISVTFTPATTGKRTGSITVTDNATNSPQMVALTGTGVAQVVVSPISIVFGAQNVGTMSAAKIVTVTNNLNSALTITSIAITGTDSGDFNETNACGGSVPPKSKCTISVTFTPAAPGARTASMIITNSANTSPQTVSLTGTGM